MTETRLLDFSFSRPSITQIKTSGAVGVLRYLTRHTGDAKVLTAAEAKAYRNAQLWVGVVFEDTAGRAGQGRQAGRDDAIFAAQQARAIGIPTTCPIFFAVDFDTTPETVTPYFAGIRDAKTSYPTGVYGSLKVVDGIMGAALAGYGWQTVAWSKGQLSARAHIYQRNTSKQPVPGTDENVLLKSLPLWGAPLAPARPAVRPSGVKPTPAPEPTPKPTPAPEPTPKPTPTPVQEDDMALIVKHPDKPDQFVLPTDLQTKVHIVDDRDRVALEASGLYKRVTLTAAQLDAAETVTATP